MLQIQKVALVAAEKTHGGQLLLPLGHGAGGDVIPAGGVEDEAVPLALQVVEFPGVQFQRAPLDGNGDKVALPLFHPLNGPGQPLGEGEVAYRFEHIVHGVHSVAPDGVLGHVGDKDDDHLGVLAADELGGGHPVQEGHLHIQEDDVKLGLVALHQLVSVGVGGDLHSCARFPAELLHIVLQLSGVGGLVLRNGNSNHVLCPLSKGWFSP